MARDYTKYNVEGLGENLNKRKLVFTIVKDWVEKNNPSFEDLQKAFPDEVQGSKGFIRKEAEVKTQKHFNMREPLKIKNGMHVVVSNQWGENINGFIESANKLNYQIMSNQVPAKQNQVFELALDTNFPTSLVKQLTDNRKNEDFLTLTNDFFEKQLRTSHKYFGPAKLFEALTNRYYDNEADEFEAYFSYEMEDYEAAFRINEDEWELKDSLTESPLLDQILDLEGLEVSEVNSLDFKLYYTAYFKYVIEQLAYCEDTTMLAEFIVAQALGYSLKIEEEGFEYSEDWLVEFIDKLLLNFYGIDVNNEDYQGEFSSNGQYFGVSSDFEINYEKIAQEIIDSVI